jgi:ABC-2 type transport system ATP-binding protein
VIADDSRADQGERLVIEAYGLTKRYGRTLAVDDLSFTVRPGVVTGFLGPNGAGKTTTMRLILGLDRPTAGMVTIGGCPHRQAPSPMREVGALIDARSAHGGRSARNHLLCLAETNGIPPQRVNEALDIVGLSDVASRRSRGFSLGMSQRLGIAAALLGDPQVLMFDEPVNGLDPEGILWIRNLMRSLAAEGRVVFVSSHLMSEMENTADHLIVVGRGRLIADCGMAEFIDRSSGQAVVVRTPSPEVLERAVAAAGGSVTREPGQLRVRGLAEDQVGDIAFAAGVPVGTAHNWPHMAVQDRAAFDATQASVAGLALLGQLIIAVLGTLVLTSEYSTGMIRTSLTVMPRRAVLYWSKAAVLAAITAVIAVLTSIAVFLVGQALLHGTHESASLSQPGALRAVLLGGAYVALSGLLAYGLGPIVRSTAGGISAAFGLMFLVPQLAKALPSSWYQDLERWLPGGDIVPAITSSQNHPLNPNVFSGWGEFAGTLEHRHRRGAVHLARRGRKARGQHLRQAGPGSLGQRQPPGHRGHQVPRGTSLTAS